MDQFILALDQGTTSSRAIIFDHDGNIKGLCQQEFAQHFPKPGWVEHEPMEIRDSQFAVARQVLSESGVSVAQIAAIGITNQRETTIVWDKHTGEPVYRAIVWQDRRTAGQCEELVASGLGRVFEERTGLLIDPYFSGTKLAWILDHVPGARMRAERGELAFGTVDSWLAWQITGRHVTDPSNASRTLLFNISTLAWDAELLGLLRIPRAVLPEVVPTSGVFGRSREDFLGAAIPVAAMVGDQQAACFGQMCLHPGMAKNTYGTGCFMLLNAGSTAIRGERLLSSVGWQYTRAGQQRLDYVLEGSVFSAGAAIQWLRDGLGIISSASEVEQLAKRVPDSGGVMMVPAFAGLGAPHWDPDARASILGMTRGSTSAHIARAAVESIAYQVAELLRVMQSKSALPLRELRVDGGASRNDLLMQFQADLLGIAVVRPLVTETTAMGAAFLAGLAVGYWENEEEIEQLWREERRFIPSMDRARRETLLANWSAAVQATRQFKPTPD
jgi:glycerol kinase